MPYRHLNFICLVIYLATLAGSVGYGQTADTLHLLSDIRLDAELLGWAAADRMEFRFDKQRATVDRQQLVRWGSLSRSRRYSLLMTTDGSWIAGRLERIDEQQIWWNLNYGEPMRIARPFVRAVVFRPTENLVDWEQQLQHIFDAQGVDDSVLTADDGWTTGVLHSPAGSQVLLDINDRRAEIHLRQRDRIFSVEWPRVQTIVFSPSLTQLQIQPKPRWLIGFKDGTRLRANQIEITPARTWIAHLGVPVQWTTADGPQEVAKRVEFVQSFPSGVRFLGDEEPASYKHLPQWSRELPLGRNKNLRHEPLIAAGRIYLRGLAMPSSAQSAYRLESGVGQQFLAELKIADSVPESHRALGSLVAKILVSRDGPLETVYTSPVIRQTTPSIPVQINLDRCRALVLLVEPADQGDVNDQLLWLDARIEKRQN